MSEYPRLQVAGEASLIIYLAEAPSARVSARLQALEGALREQLQAALEDLIPSYASLLVLFDPEVADHFYVAQVARDALSELRDVAVEEGKLVEIPAYYAPESGEDIETLGQTSGLGWEGVAALHAACEYRVYAIGFAPGFAYLGEVDERIAAPRLSTPRPAVPRGAIAIADRQTAVYPEVSPGGWNLIGRSPQRMFDPDANDPMPVRVGDRVRFAPLSRAEYAALGGVL